MNLPKYSLVPPVKYGTKTSLFKHHVFIGENCRFIIPHNFDGKTINPKNFLKLKNKLRIKSIIVVDKTRPENQRYSIMNHINRSGYNFLIGRTPIESLPMFPDMSKVYNKIKGLEAAVVHTVGPSRFSSEERNNKILSEYVGLVAPVWHYIGVKVFAQNFDDSA